MNDAYFQAVKHIESDEPTKKPNKSVFGVGDAAAVYYADVVAPETQTQPTPPPEQFTNERLDELQRAMNQVTQSLQSNIPREEFDRLVAEHRRLSEEVQQLLSFMRTVFAERGLSQPPPPPPPLILVFLLFLFF